MQVNLDVTARAFALPHSNQVLVLESPVLKTFLQFRQTGDRSEAGGLLFGEFCLPKISIIEASKPGRLDRRARTLFMPNRPVQQMTIREQFNRGRHFVGEWHTHPEPNPTPSRMDLESMADSFVKSRHELNCFIMVIVGNNLSQLCLWVSAHDGQQAHILQELLQKSPTGCFT